MTKIPALRPTLQAWLLEGPLSAQVPAYVARLKRGRYATHTSGRCLNAVANFAHWMSMCHLPARMLDGGRIDQFLRHHLPRCECLGGALRTPNEAHAALIPMLEILRTEGVIARAPAPIGPIADELRSCDAHMRDARGLASGTRTGRLRTGERLLVFKFAGRPVFRGELQADDIRNGSSSPTSSMPWAPPATRSPSRPPCGPTCATAQPVATRYSRCWPSSHRPPTGAWRRCRERSSPRRWIGC